MACSLKELEEARAERARAEALAEEARVEAACIRLCSIMIR